MKYKYCLLISFYFITTCFVVAQNHIILSEGRITINDTIIDTIWKRNSFIKALGETGIKPKKNLDTYHSKGIALHLENKQTEVTEMKVFFNRKLLETWKRYCRKDYLGTLHIEGVLISSATRLEELLELLPQYHFQPTFGWYRGEYKDIYIFTQFNPISKTLACISIGPIDAIVLD